MADQPRDPRIRVDLNILRDANLDRLEEFAKQFSDPANRLADAMEKFNARAGRFGAQGGGAEGPGGASASASVAGPGGVGTGQGGTPPGGGAPDQPSAGASVPGGSPQRLEGLSRFALAGPTLNQFERGQIRLGAFPGGSTTAQALFAASWLTGKAGWSKVGEQGEPPMLNGQIHPDAIQGEDGGWYMPRGTGRMGQVSGALGFAGQASMRVPQIYNSAMGLYSKIAGAGSGLAAAGMQSGGYSRTGGWGLPLFGPAMMHGLGMQFNALKQSWFGFNPNYSTAQAQAAQQAIASSGYWGSDAHFLASQMRNLQITSNMSPDETMALFDPLMRMGGEDRGRLAESLKSLNDSAKAAHIGLDQFNQGLVQASEQLSQQTGMQTGQASSVLQALSAGTRLSPQTLSQLGNPSNLIMGAALTGTPIQKAVLGGQAAGSLLALPTRIFGTLLGMPFDTYSRLKRANQNDPRVVAAEQRISYAYLSNPQIFGGMDPRTMMNLAARGVNMSERVQAYQDATGSMFNHTDAGFEKLIKQFGAGGPAGGQLLHEFHQKFGHVTGKNSQAAQEWLTKRMADVMNKSSDKAQQKVTLTLDNWAKQLVHFKGGQAPSKSHSNTLDNIWHRAIDMAPSVAEQTAKDMILGPLGNLLP